MGEHHQPTEGKRDPHKRQRAIPVSAQPANDQADRTELAELGAGSIGTPASALVQAAGLGDGGLTGAQRRALASQIGRLQGNRHLQKVLASLKKGDQKAYSTPVLQEAEAATVMRAPEPAGLAAAEGTIVKDRPGPVTEPGDSQFTLRIDDPPPLHFYYSRWSARDPEDNAYMLRSVDDDEIVQQYGRSQHVYIAQPSLQIMFEKGVGPGCRFLCRVVETASAMPPGYGYPADNTRLFSTGFDFQPKPGVFKRMPQDITAIAWSGDIDVVTWLAAALRIGEIQVNSIDRLAAEVENALESDRHYVRHLTIGGHGFSGHMSPNLSSLTINGANRAALSRMKPLFGPDSTVRLDGCEVAQGPVGRRLIQELADLWGVPVSAQTSFVHFLGWYDLGVEQVAVPGVALGTDAEIVADQVYRAIEQTTVITARIVVKQLEQAKDAGILWDVVKALRLRGVWPTVRGKLDWWHSTAILPWFGEDAGISERIERLGILALGPQLRALMEEEVLGLLQGAERLATGEGAVQRRPGVAASQPREARAAPVADEIGRAQSEAATPIGAGTARRITAAGGSGRGMEPRVRTEMEGIFGQDLGHVRVHTDEAAARMAGAAQARAFATGDHIFFNDGGYSPSTPEGKRVLAHEVSHVVERRHKHSVSFWGNAAHIRFTTDMGGILGLSDVMLGGLREACTAMDRRIRRLASAGARLIGEAPAFTIKPEGPDHGEAGMYRTSDWGAAEAENKARQDSYLKQAVAAVNRSSALRAEGGTSAGSAEVLAEGYNRLGDALHVAQDRGSHAEGVKGFGHDQDAYDCDDPSENPTGVRRAEANTFEVLGQFIKATGWRTSTDTLTSQVEYRRRMHGELTARLARLRDRAPGNVAAQAEIDEGQGYLQQAARILWQSGVMSDEEMARADDYLSSAGACASGAEHSVRSE